MLTHVDRLPLRPGIARNPMCKPIPWGSDPKLLAAWQDRTHMKQSWELGWGSGYARVENRQFEGYWLQNGPSLSRFFALAGQLCVWNSCGWPLRSYQFETSLIMWCLPSCNCQRASKSSARGSRPVTEQEGKTGYPFIDALMRQLKQIGTATGPRVDFEGQPHAATHFLQGFMHHLGRHAVACFLTRGACLSRKATGVSQGRASWERILAGKNP